MREQRIVLEHEANLALAYIALSGNRRALKAGEYLFDKPMTIPEVIGKLSRGEIYLHRFTVPEGFTVKDIANAWQAQGFGMAEEFLQAAADSGSLVQDLEGGEKASLEGYLFPETYSFPSRTTARKAIEAVVEVGAVPVVVMAIADREDPDADAFRREFRVESLLTLQEIRGG